MGLPILPSPLGGFFIALLSFPCLQFKTPQGPGRNQRQRIRGVPAHISFPRETSLPGRHEGRRPSLPAGRFPLKPWQYIPSPVFLDGCSAGNKGLPALVKILPQDKGLIHSYFQTLSPCGHRAPHSVQPQRGFPALVIFRAVCRKVFQVHSAYQKRYSFFYGLSFQTCLSFLSTPFPSSPVSTRSGVRACCLPGR